MWIFEQQRRSLKKSWMNWRVNLENTRRKKLIKINSDRMCDRFWMEKLTTKITTLITKKRVLGKFPNKKVKCLTFLRILQITFGDSEKAIQKAVQKTIHSAIRKQGLPYAKLYKMAQLPYDAIQKAVQYSRKAIQCHTRSCTRRLESHTVRLN